MIESFVLVATLLLGSARPTDDAADACVCHDAGLPSEELCPEGQSQTMFGCLDDPRRIEYAAPKYPLSARRNWLEACVVFQVVLGTDGKLEKITLVSSSSPERAFEKAARKAMRKWRYEPVTLEDKPVEVAFCVIVEFVLGERHPSIKEKVASPR